ncbi:MAG: hypothetical protein IK990_07340 [Ruminiclostridium sp.]|nr:hypothetical protein [Ruminiclostridium sp.]
MKTSNEYNENIKNRIITPIMLAECIYSVNKRAKNYRDKIFEFDSIKRNNPHWTDKFGNVENWAAKMDEYYYMKEKMLSLLKPEFIHRKIKTGEYFFCYSICNYSFHSPIGDYSEDMYEKYEVIDVNFSTEGKEVKSLVSVQLVKKVIDLINSNDYTFEYAENA